MVMEFSRMLNPDFSVLTIAVIAAISGFTCKQAKRVNSSLYWPFCLVCLHFGTGEYLDHVYFVHPSTDISVDISVDISADTRPMYWLTYQPSVDWYVSRHIGRVSVDMSTDMSVKGCTKYTWSEYLTADLGRRGVLPDKRLMGICRWMGPHFHNWIDYHGVAFSIQLLERGHTFSKFWG